MASTVIHSHGVPQDDYGLDAIAKHNAQSEQFPPYHEDSRGLGFYGEYAPLYEEEQSYIHNPPTPRSNTASEGIRTRSGRSTRPTDSPMSANKCRVSKSPAPRGKKEKKSKLDRSKTPKLTAPLSVLTKDMSIPLRDIEAYVNRPAEERVKEMADKKYVTRPMNSFMLYRSAYKDRTKQWCSQNNHQIISSVTGESWPMEPDEVRHQFDEWAKTERQHHQEAHPNYKFSPSKSSTKRRKGEFSDDEDEPSDLDGDPDGEYRGGRNVRQRRHDQGETPYIPNTVGFDSHPYYGHHVSGYEQYQYAHAGRPLPSNVAYDHNGLPYNPQTNTYLQQNSMHYQQQQQQYGYMQDMQAARVPTPGSMSGQQSLGGYGLPGGQSAEDIFSTSRSSTPMQHYHQYGGPAVYPPYQTQYHHQQQQQQQQQTYQPMPAAGSAMYEHQQYLQQAAQPATAIDPTLEAAMEAAAAASSVGTGVHIGAESHFAAALGDLAAANEMAGMHDFYERQSTGPDTTLAPTWSPTDLKG